MLSLEDNHFYSSVPDEADSTEILHYTTRHSTVDSAVWTEKLNLLNSVSVATMCSVKSYNKCSKCSLSALTDPQSFTQQVF